MEISLSENCTITTITTLRKKCQFVDPKTGITCNKKYSFHNRKKDENGKVSYPNFCGKHAVLVNLAVLRKQRREAKNHATA
jgi:hypothetical protein